MTFGGLLLVGGSTFDLLGFIFTGEGENFLIFLSFDPGVEVKDLDLLGLSFTGVRMEKCFFFKIL